MGSEETQNLYEALAGRFDHHHEPRQRDIFLVLAADAALTGGRGGEAERIRARLLQANPHHLLKPFPTMREALESGDIRDYVADLRRRFPTAHAAELFEKMRAKEAPIEPPMKPERSVFNFKEEPSPVKDEPFIAVPAKKRPPTRSPYELLPEPEPPKERSPDAAGRFVANVLFLFALLFTLAVAVVVFLRPFFPG
ncbi:MAG: hypothetical protein HY040_09720 [Planctomycetes bacterium]|nr:hypothetical protein [Planctomycetota bacterium]